MRDAAIEGAVHVFAVVVGAEHVTEELEFGHALGDQGSEAVDEHGEGAVAYGDAEDVFVEVGFDCFAEDCLVIDGSDEGNDCFDHVREKILLSEITDVLGEHDSSGPDRVLCWVDNAMLDNFVEHFWRSIYEGDVKLSAGVVFVAVSAGSRSITRGIAAISTTDIVLPHRADDLTKLCALEGRSAQNR